MLKTSFEAYLLEKGWKIKDPKPIRRAEEDYTRNIPPRYLITGKVGTGKTIFAKELCLWTGRRYITLDIDKFSRADAEDIRFLIADYPIIVIDDLGAETPNLTSRCIANLMACFRAVENGSGVGLVITTNFNSEGLRDKYGDRVYDRISGNLTVFCLAPPSFRKQAMEVIK